MDKEVVVHFQFRGLENGWLTQVYVAEGYMTTT